MASAKSLWTSGGPRWALLSIIWLFLATTLPKDFAAAAPTTVRLGYPQPSSTQLPRWMMSEAKLDGKYGVDSDGARLTQTLIAGNIDMATNDTEDYDTFRGIFLKVLYFTEDDTGAVLSGTDHSKAASADPRDFFDNRFIKELEESEFVKDLYGQK